jgi:modulator of FtsH protease HflK
MPRSEGGGSSDEVLRRGVGRTLAWVALLGISLGLIAAWSYFGFYQLDPGEDAVILRLGRYARTVSEPGLKWHVPPPIESHQIVNVEALEREAFGYRPGEAEPSPDELAESAMQTRDNNIVHVAFEVQYRIRDPFQARYRIADPKAVLRDSAQAAMREVVGRETIDGVLSERRAQVAQEARQILQQLLEQYQTGLVVDTLALQDVQPPPQVRDAFDDVIASMQDRNRAVNEAQGYANEVLPRARAKAREELEGARAYKESLVAEAQGEASRFRALAEEYLKAPEVTRTRLYLETMEEVLPRTHTVVMEPGTAVIPYLPLGQPIPGPAR